VVSHLETSTDQMILPGGYSRFQVMGMIGWEQKSKPKKTLGPKISLPKNLCQISEPQKFPKIKTSITRTTRLGYKSTTMNLQTVLNTPKNTDNYMFLGNFPYPSPKPTSTLTSHLGSNNG